MGFLCEFVSLIRVLQGSLRMPVSGLVIAFFIMFGGGAMGFARKFVKLGGSLVGFLRFPMSVVHALPPLENYSTLAAHLHEADQPPMDRPTGVYGAWVLKTRGGPGSRFASMGDPRARAQPAGSGVRFGGFNGRRL
jgi:hypothetical protein